MNINIITGLPYTGKGQFGRKLAERLGCPFIRDFDIITNDPNTIPSDKLYTVALEMQRKEIDNLVFLSSSFVTGASRYLAEEIFKTLIGIKLRYIFFENDLELANQNIDLVLKEDGNFAKNITKEFSEKYSLPKHYIMVGAKRYETYRIQEDQETTQKENVGD